jgi:hypothetical protein
LCTLIDQSDLGSAHFLSIPIRSSDKTIQIRLIGEKREKTIHMSNSLAFSHHKTSHQMFELIYLLFSILKEKEIRCLFLLSMKEISQSVTPSKYPNTSSFNSVLHCYHHSKHKIQEKKNKKKGGKEPITALSFVMVVSCSSLDEFHVVVDVECR